MKFSEIRGQDWPELAPYVDTCLLPVTGLSGAESPAETAGSLERLRDIMDLVEIPFKGRIVTYPAIQYRGPDVETLATVADHVCTNLKSAGFRFVILISADPVIQSLKMTAADLVLSPDGRGEEELKTYINRQIPNLWENA